jgi:methionine sulfoxide reductase heme-binding subunit
VALVRNHSMSVSYRAVGWNRQKRLYDNVLAGAVFCYLSVFMAGGARLDSDATAETLVIRATGTAALLLLHVILSIGPLCRLDRRFLPLLYNRRHLGVTMFLLALTHGLVSVVQFHAWGDRHPLVSLLVSSGDYRSLTDFPFQPLGLMALAILFLMAATSHDFWLRTLTAPVWKSLHMLVYVAYALIVLHVVFGALQVERHLLLTVVVWVGLLWLLTIHLLAALRERRLDMEQPDTGDFLEVCHVNDIPDGRARIVSVSGERVAVFRYGHRISAVSSVCRHQNGPLGEGRIVNGCIVCPWHGYEYEPASGRAPAPFTERLPTFDVRIVGDRVQIGSRPHPAGTYVEPARMADAAAVPPASLEIG